MDTYLVEENIKILDLKECLDDGDVVNLDSSKYYLKFDMSPM
jgi:hypothetical protein